MMRQKTYVLAKAILERKDILFGSSENVFKPQILKEKEDAWEAVRAEMIEQGFEQFQRKSWRDVRNHDWQYLRRSAVAKYEHNQKPGVEPIPYNDVDRVVFEIMGNEFPSSTNDCVNGAIAASYNWLKTEDTQQQQQNISFDGSESSFNADQQQINTLLNSALAVSASMLGRKMSWETCSPAESPCEKQQQRPFLQSQQNQNNEIEVVAQQKNKEATRNGPVPNADLLQSIIAASTSLPQPAAAQQSSNLERHEARPSVSSGVITSSSTTAPSRKRQHSSSSGARSIEDEIQEAKLKHILLQVKREEILLQQEKAKLLQEEVKLRQERIKAELLERKLQDNERSE